MSDIARAIIHCIKKGGRIFIIGNGGSAAEATHWTGEFLGKFEKEGRPLPAVNLYDLATITAIANDYGYEFIFSRQLQALGNKGDVLITLSTSGKSPNIVTAIAMAKSRGMKVISLPTNKDTGLSTAGTQQLHLDMIHGIMRLVEKELR